MRKKMFLIGATLAMGALTYGGQAMADEQPVEKPETPPTTPAPEPEPAPVPAPAE